MFATDPTTPAPAVSMSGDALLGGELLQGFFDDLPSPVALLRVNDGGDVSCPYANAAFASLGNAAGAPGVIEATPSLREACARVAGGGPSEELTARLGGAGRRYAVRVRSPKRGLVHVSCEPRGFDAPGHAGATPAEGQERAVIECTFVGFVRVGLHDHTLRWANPAFARLLGYAVPEIVGINTRRLFPSDAEFDAFGAASRAAMAVGGVYRGQIRQVRKDASVASFDILCSIAPDDSGEVVGTLVDVSETKHLEDALTQSASMLSEAERIAHLGSWRRDLVADVASWSPEMFRIYEVDPARGALGWGDLMALVHPEDREDVARHLASARRDRTPLDFAHRTLGPGGRVKRVHIRGEMFFAENGAPTHSVGTAQDISLLVEQTDALAREERRLRSVFAAMSEGVIVQRPDGRVVDANPAAAEMLGVSLDALIGGTSADPSWQPLREDLTPMPGDEHPGRMSLKTGRPVRNKILGMRTGSGARRWMSVNASPIPGVDPSTAEGVVATFLDITERKRAEAIFLGMFNQSSFLAGILDPSDRLMDVNGTALRFCDATREELLGRYFPDTPWWRGRGDRQRIVAALASTRQGASATFEATHVAPDGRRLEVAVTTMPIVLEDGLAIAVFGVDITDRKRAERALRESEDRFRIMADGVHALIWISDAEGRATWFNRGWLAFTGRAVAQELSYGWIEAVHPDDLPRVRDLHDVGVQERREVETDFRLRRSDGEYRWMAAHAVARFDEAGAFLGHVGTCFDVSERHLKEQEIERLAFYDPLTRLASRRLLHDRLDLALASSKRTGLRGALLVIDLDEFKPLNDRHGHHVGDLLLIEVGERLRRCVRQVDTAARLGGDEFVVVLAGIAATAPEATARAGVVAEKLRAALGAPYVLTLVDAKGIEHAIEHRCTATVGVAMFDAETPSADDLFDRADAAMYRAKAAGRNRVCFDGDDAESRSVGG